ncbi:ubiquinol-cytochrome c reductase iron-sulfur subunit [Magnetospirillum sp. 64-120]|uniref:ubiquinol-cytochrome c reductase iron-sulfur subunit n=1 Tax=Magnetospirillum sp. 64-120 TaxID=1895778 RepID=UPI0009281797|nr:ubiquinol-cytochrome c reductase iron-sulfur subunit [Magnetospirillum sp. 64-120]OJX77372.1 MAG: ubiquinol-cytochrome c reductase iron-sulfur subunit [Magnetospirillum sp. 64-120]
MADSATHAQPSSTDGQTRRDFLLYATTAVGAAGTAAALWPFVHSMNPAADTLAMSTTDVDLAAIQPGQAITVVWQGKPVFVRRRTEEEIAAATKDDAADLRDKATDASRVQKPEWLILIGVCTHLGCVPLGQKAADPKGDFGGWFCPCHGSHYDTSGRIRKGPAPLNLPVPKYTFTSDTTVRIG